MKKKTHGKNNLDSKLKKFWVFERILSKAENSGNRPHYHIISGLLPLLILSQMQLNKTNEKKVSHIIFIGVLIITNRTAFFKILIILI